MLYLTYCSKNWLLYSFSFFWCLLTYKKPDFIQTLNLEKWIKTFEIDGCTNFVVDSVSVYIYIYIYIYTHIYNYSLDIENLFTNVPVNETINIIINNIYNPSLPPLKIDPNILKKLLLICTTEVPFYNPWATFTFEQTMYLWVQSWAQFSVISICLTVKMKYLIALKTLQYT